jgi:hypothetical protein
MSLKSKLLLDEMNRLFYEKKTQIDTCFTEADQKLDARFGDSDASWSSASPRSMIQSPSASPSWRLVLPRRLKS